MVSTSGVRSPYFTCGFCLEIELRVFASKQAPLCSMSHLASPSFLMLRLKCFSLNFEARLSHKSWPGVRHFRLSPLSARL